MADIDTVLERLVTDPDFRERLGSDPAGALAGYELDADDLALLASSLDDGDAGPRGVEQRTSKSALAGLLASFAAGGGPAVDADGATGGQSAPSGNQANKWPLDPPKFKQRFESHEPAVDDLAAPDDQGDGAGTRPGRPKVNDVTLKRGAFGAADPGGAAPDLTDADSGEPEPAAFKQGFPVKWQGAAAGGEDVDATAAPDVAEVDEGGADGSPADVAAPGAAGSEQGIRHYKLTGAWPKSGPPPEDFLTIEDE